MSYDPDFDAPVVPPKDTYLKELRESFTQTPDNVRISVSEVVVNGARFVENHLSLVEYNWGKPIARPYLARLLRYRTIIFS